jgi:exonuclease SbcC
LYKKDQKEKLKMKLVLNNFRKFINKEFIFEKNQTLIFGKSGKGKSTIFMAIIFALNGEGKKLISFGKTSCSVILDINSPTNENVIITRTKRPNRLIVVHNSTQKEDLEAQVFLDNLFFQYQTGYISQRLDKNFLLMSSLDKISFIEKAAFGTFENPDLIVKNCKDLVKNRKNELTNVQLTKKTIQNVLSELKIEKIPFCNTQNLDENEIENEIFSLEKLLKESKEKFNTFSECEKRKKEMKDRLEKLNQLIEKSDTIDNIDEKIKQFSLETSSWNQYQKAKSLLKKLKTSNFDIENEQKIIDLEKIIEHSKKINFENEKILEELNKKILQSATKLKCPNCESYIALWGDSLSIIDNNNFFSHEIISVKEVKNLESQRNKLLQLVEENKKNFISMKNLCEKYLNIFDIEELKCLSLVKKKASEKLKQLNELKTNADNYNSQKTICLSLKIKKPNYEENFELKIKNKRSILFEIKEIQKSLKKEKENNLESLEKEIIEIEQKLQKLIFKKSSVKSFKHWNKIDLLTKEENILEKSYPRSLKLQEIIKTATKQSVKEVIEEINLTAQIYLDSFLENVVAELKFENNEKLNCQVIQNGNKTDLNNLSGGEFARVVLAFNIAFADVNNVKLLLIDEITASLDQETTNQVMNTIKQNYKGQVIVIAHQTTTGIFEEVVDL